MARKSDGALVRVPACHSGAMTAIGEFGLTAEEGTPALQMPTMG